MATLADSSFATESDVDRLDFARAVLRVEAEALERVRERLDGTIVRAADLIQRCRGSVIVTGMGKAGPGRPEARRHPGLDRDPGVSPAPGRGRAWRPRADPPGRRGARPLAERRDRGGGSPHPRACGGWARLWWP